MVLRIVVDLKVTGVPMPFELIRDGAYGTAAANDCASPLRWVPCAAALMERADRRHALIDVPLDPMQYRKTLYYMVIVFMTQSFCTEGSPCQDRCRLDFWMRLLHAKALGSLSARSSIFCLLYHEGTRSCRPHATSRVHRTARRTVAFPDAFRRT